MIDVKTVVKNTPKAAVLWYLFALVWIALDQWTKYLAIHHLKTIAFKPLMGDLLRLSYAENTGMAFSISIFPPVVLLLVNCIAAVVIAVIIWRVPLGFVKSGALALIMAGALGNAIDRFRFGYVVDFIDADFPDFIMHRWPIFNLADSGISIGVTLFVLLVLLEKPSPESKPLATKVSDPTS
ncbi:MAG: signal peptidase II [bacterium]|nr:signal peptidase II [bacterium]